ncbi:MAG TPA: nucleotidyl transferase AbiEii/AbiGii toxin family protein [Candidatus Onthousia excrementipullorum]|uniref:Nucleotidyl transferase AbiEii/AbiGii toxin family protein n=1 Tax=Candidatus Onthousia excrementipullorum TaxID=2840884 RepID=A0A9D1DVJ0_9FIRM|nr:nucleotidyl transferase AbiEii/AbiGii toxin family protein [Candidatus Onthousia excrementipullorum]
MNEICKKIKCRKESKRIYGGVVIINQDKLKSLVAKKALGSTYKSQIYFQLFYFERLLERISKSKYKNYIILKGGLVLTSIIGSDDRTTKDMDATIKGIPLSENIIKEIFKEIFSIDLDDGVTFELISIKDIRLEDKYGGFRLNILSKLGNNKTYITVELTTGDEITPREIKFSYNSIFEDKKIPIMAYNIETILAEKFHSIISRGILNTRLKDFYDVYMLFNFKEDIIDKKLLVKAIENTFKKRDTLIDIDEFVNLIDDLYNNDSLKKLWSEYQNKNTYAKGIDFVDVIDSVKIIVNILEETLITV